MKLNDIYSFFIQEGMKVDPRKKDQVQQRLRDERKIYNKLSKAKQKFFDKDNLRNPYSDTRILYGNPKREIKRILVGIDVGLGELMMVEKLNERGAGIDLIVAHHPIGIALAGLHEVMDLQTDLLENLGFDAEVADSVMGQRIAKVERGIHSCNHNRTVDAARLLDIPLMCCHTPADNHVSSYLQKLMNRKKPKTLESMVDLLLREPEYKDGQKNKAGPTILIGKPDDKVGKVLVDMTGGTEGSTEIFGRLSQCGIKTLLAMHLSENHYGKVKSEHMNVVNAGHMASDNLGINLLLDKLVKKAKIDIVDCSGFRRFKR